MRLRSVVFHVNEIGFQAAPIIALMGFFVMKMTGADLTEGAAPATLSQSIPLVVDCV